MASWCCARQLSQHSGSPVSELRKKNFIGGSRKQEKSQNYKKEKPQLWSQPPNCACNSASESEKRLLSIISEKRNILLHCTRLGTSLCHAHSCYKNCTWDFSTCIHQKHYEIMKNKNNENWLISQKPPVGKILFLWL